MTAAAGPPPGMVAVPGGVFTMGSDRHHPEEGPARRVRVAGFLMDRGPVTVAEFARFVDDTGHVTVAERAPDPALCPGADPSLLVAGSIVFRPEAALQGRGAPGSWWAYAPRPSAWTTP